MDISPSWTHEHVPDRAAPLSTAPASAEAAPKPKLQARKAADYYPLFDTLRLYAGWLLAWYVAIYALGAYQVTRRLPVELSLVEELFFSPLILHFAVAAYLFLTLSSLHRLLRRNRLAAVGLWVLGILLFLVFRTYS